MVALLVLFGAASCGGNEGTHHSATTTTTTTTQKTYDDTTAWCSTVREAAQAQADYLDQPDVIERMRRAQTAAEAQRIADENKVLGDRVLDLDAKVHAATPPRAIASDVQTLKDIPAETVSISDGARRDAALDDIQKFIARKCDVRYRWE